MAARAIGSGNIAFGLVAIPVKLFPATNASSAIRFNQLHAECGTRLKQQLHCPQCDVVVGRDEIVKGYEFAKGQYVTFDKEELEAVQEQSTGDIDIVEFVPLDDVDPIFFDKAYYLGPERGGNRAYHLLAQAMRDTGLSAVATYAARGKQYLVLLRPVEEGIVLQQLNHSFEIRAFDDVEIDDAEVKDAELQLAKQLIQQAAVEHFEPEKYKDEVRERIEAMIQAKVEGEEITSAPAETPKAQVIDLMAALKASLSGETEPTEEAAKPAKHAEGSERKAPKRASKKAKKSGKKSEKSAEG